MARRDPSFVLPGSHFAGMTLSHVIASDRLNGMKKLINISVQKYPFNKSKIFISCFYDAFDVNLWEKKLTNIFVEFHHFTEGATGDVWWPTVANLNLSLHCNHIHTTTLHWMLTLKSRIKSIFNVTSTTQILLI